MPGSAAASKQLKLSCSLLRLDQWADSGCRCCCCSCCCWNERRTSSLLQLLLMRLSFHCHCHFKGQEKGPDKRTPSLKNALKAPKMQRVCTLLNSRQQQRWRQSPEQTRPPQQAENVVTVNHRSHTTTSESCPRKLVSVCGSGKSTAGSMTLITLPCPPPRSKTWSS